MAPKLPAGPLPSQLRLQQLQLLPRRAVAATTTTTSWTHAQQQRWYSAPANNSVPASKRKYVPTSGTYPRGFQASGTVVGVKPGNTTKPDLALLATDAGTPCAAAAVFTKNKFQAAPVTFSRALLQQRANAGLRGVVVNSGCANAVTGRGGLADAAAMGRAADAALGAEEGSTIVMSTGVIGQRCVIFFGGA